MEVELIFHGSPAYVLVLNNFISNYSFEHDKEDEKEFTIFYVIFCDQSWKDRTNLVLWFIMASSLVL